jgi:hypothetical protein
MGKDMRIKHILASGLISLLLAACSGIEVEPAAIEEFAAGNYTYYKWRTKPLQNTANSSDPAYILDPIVRKRLDAELQGKGYILDPKRAQFSVDYLYAIGMTQGAKSQEASNISTYPTVTANRQVNQAVVDNANALGGVKETSNIGIQFNDVAANEEVWRVMITKIVENVNRMDTDNLQKNLTKSMREALSTLPPAS